MIPKFTKNYHIWSITLPVYGTRDGKGRLYTLRTLYKLLEKIFDELNIEKPILIGHSMGGMVAIRYSVAHPRKVSKIVTVSTPLSDFKEDIPLEWKLAVSFGIKAKRAQDLINYVLNHETLFERLSKVLFPGRSPKRKVETAHAFLSSLPVKALSTFYHHLFTYNYKKFVESVSVPALMIYGTKDAELARFRGTALYSLVPGVKIVPLPTYHFIPVDMPEELSKITNEWLNNGN